MFQDSQDFYTKKLWLKTKTTKCVIKHFLDLHLPCAFLSSSIIHNEDHSMEESLNLYGLSHYLNTGSESLWPWKALQGNVVKCSNKYMFPNLERFYFALLNDFRMSGSITKYSVEDKCLGLFTLLLYLALYMIYLDAGLYKTDNTKNI